MNQQTNNVFKRNRNQYFSRENLIPLGKELGISSIAGFCSGAFCKGIGRKTFIIFGGVFIMLQYLQYKGYATINWSRIENDAKKTLQKLTNTYTIQNRIKDILNKFMKILKNRLPSGAVFTTFFILGLKF